MDIDTVTIHQVIDGIPREEEVPESTVAGWEAVGWIRGPFPRAAAVVDNRPPKAGRGSDLSAWVDYAAQRDIVLEVGATRADIIAAVEALDGSETSPLGETPTSSEEG
jgi:hypothetical protein